MINTAVWPTKKMKVTNLTLDEANIRIDIESPTQDSIIQDLFLNEDALQIVESIMLNGFFGQELPIVTKEKGKDIVLEGNRRTAALKAILNPKLVPSFEAQIIKLIDGQDTKPLQEIDIKVAPSRDDALKLIASIHTVTTRKRWRPLRQAYFYYAQLESGKKIEDLILEYTNADIPRFVKMWEMHKIAQSIKYDDVAIQQDVSSRNFKISTFERLYQNDKFRTQFGLSFNKNGEVQVASDLSDFKESLKQVVTDIVTNKVDSRKLNNQSQLDAYLKDWKTPKKKATDQKPKTSEDFKPEPIPPKVKVQTALIGKEVTYGLSGIGVQKRLEELQKLPYRTYPNIAHDALRSLLECSLKAYCAHVGTPITPKRQGGFVQLQDSLEAVKSYFNAQGIRKDLVQVINKAISKKEVFSTKEYLDAINHNPNIISSPDDVKNAWDDISSLIVYVLDPK